MSDYDSKILIGAIERPQVDVRDILKEAKKTLDAKNARFRPKGWNDKSVVHVANWIIEEEDNSSLGLVILKPELAERVFYDPDNPSRVDCFVGKIAKIGRIKEEEMKGIFLFSWEGIPGNDNEGLIKYIKHYLGIDLENSIIIDKDPIVRTKEVYTGYLFSWDDVPGIDKERLIEFLTEKFGIDWVKTAKIEKIDNGKTIRISFGDNFLYLKLNHEKTKVKLTIDDGRNEEFIVKLQNDKQNIYYTGKKHISLKLNDKETEVSIEIDGIKQDKLFVEKENSKLKIYRRNKSNVDMLMELKKNISENDIKNPRICFHGVCDLENNDLESGTEFCNFIKLLVTRQNEILKERNLWKNQFNYLKKIKDNEKDKFFELAFCDDSPLIKEDIKVKDKNRRQWTELKKFIEKQLSGLIKKTEFSYLKNKTTDEKVKELFLNATEKTYQHYDKLYKDYENYIPDAKKETYEIVVPVLAFGQFVGVLNFHRDYIFTKKEEEVAKTFAARLAATYLQWQNLLFWNFQQVSQTISADNNFELIASEITKGIKTILQYGLNEEEIFPLLYVAKRPIDYTEKIMDEDFKLMWEFKSRQKPNDDIELKLWEEENKLGKIPIRAGGMGSAVINKWKSKMQTKTYHEAKNRFVVCPYVDNLNSDCRSISAHYNGIITTGCILLTFENKVNGLLYLHCKKRHYFTEAELYALNTLGVQAAVAIHNIKSTGESYESLYGTKILELIVNKYLFSWEKIIGDDSEILKEFLKKNYDVDWVENAKTDKTDDGKTIGLSFKNNFLSLSLNTENTEANLKIDDGRTDSFIVKEENDELNIYRYNTRGN